MILTMWPGQKLLHEIPNAVATKEFFAYLN